MALRATGDNPSIEAGTLVSNRTNCSPTPCSTRVHLALDPPICPLKVRAPRVRQSRGGAGKTTEPLSSRSPTSDDQPQLGARTTTRKSRPRVEYLSVGVTAKNVERSRSNVLSWVPEADVSRQAVRRVRYWQPVMRIRPWLSDQSWANSRHRSGVRRAARDRSRRDRGSIPSLRQVARWSRLLA